MKNIKLWIIFGIIITFVFGFTAGVFTHRLIRHSYWKHHKNASEEIVGEKLLSRISRHLNLSQAQLQAIGGILRAEANDIKITVDSYHQKLGAIKNEANEKIKQNLTPEQREKFDKLIETHKKRWKRACEV